MDPLETGVARQQASVMSCEKQEGVESSVVPIDGSSGTESEQNNTENSISMETSGDRDGMNSESTSRPTSVKDDLTEAEEKMKPAKQSPTIANGKISTENTFKVPLAALAPRAVAPHAVPNSETKSKPSVSAVSASEDKSTLSKEENSQPKPEAGLPSSHQVSAPKPFLSPAEMLKAPKPAPPLPYSEPEWGGCCPDPYSLEVIKNGAVVTTIQLRERSFCVVGRLPSCDLPLEHPSISRYHAILQYRSKEAEGGSRPRGWYLYDLNSTHGTTVNKRRCEGGAYARLRVGYCIKFGGSTRLNVLQGPEFDQEAESDLTVTELKAQREARLKQLEERLEKEGKEDASKQAKKPGLGDDASGAGGCSWGIDEDAEEEEKGEAGGVNPFALSSGEELYLDDPKKALRGWFEREGYDQPEYKVGEEGSSKYRCTVELPLDSPTGQPMLAEALTDGKKKDAVLQCALEACRMLDRHGVLRQAKHESRKRKSKNWEEADFYGSDDDTFLDRTGDIEKKRKQRMKRLGKGHKETALGFSQLKAKYEENTSTIEGLETKLANSKKKEQKARGDADDLDAYMMSIKSGALDATTKNKYRRQLMELRQEKMKLEKMIKVVDPTYLPSLQRLKEAAKISAIESAAAKLMETKAMEAKSVESNSEEVRAVDAKSASELPFRIPTASIIVGSDSAKQSQEMVLDIKSASIASMSDTPEKHHPSTISASKLSSQQHASSLEDASEKSTPVDGSNSHVETPVDLTPASPSDGSKSTTASTSEGSQSTTTSTSGGSKSSTASSTDGNKTKSNAAKRPAVVHGTKSFLEPKTKKERKDAETQKAYAEADPDYAIWVPPKGQSGDGKTKLNDRFGY